jgi:hypothetical protein
MDEAQVIVGFLFSSHQQAPCPVSPRVTSFDDPTAGSLSGATRFGFSATWWNMWYVAVAASQTFNRFAEVPFVQTEMLLASSLRLGTRYGNRSQRSAQKFLIVRVRAVDGDAQRHASRVGEHRTLDAQLTAIGGVFAGFFPHPREPWSSCHPATASANQSPDVGRRPSDMLSKTSGKCHAAPILESSDAPCSAHRTAVARLSTGNLYAVDKGCRPPHTANSRADAHLCGCERTWATTAPNVARVFRASAQIDPANRNAYTPPCHEPIESSTGSTQDVCNSSVMGPILRKDIGSQPNGTS